MKKILIIAVLVAALSSWASAQIEVDDLGSEGTGSTMTNGLDDKVVEGEPIITVEMLDGGVRVLEDKTGTQFSFSPAPGRTHVRRGRSGEYGWVHYRKSNNFKYEALAGRMLICGPDDRPIQIQACRNLVWQRQKVANTKSVKWSERTVIKREVIRVPIHHYHTRVEERIVEREKVVFQPVFVNIYTPQIMQTATILGPSTVIQSQALPSFGYNAGSRATVNIGDIIAEAAAAAAAAAAASSSSSSGD